jgi:2',3'-cyclic-nucleotide 2'-phosphodiesterase/3'-nucleotidase
MHSPQIFADLRIVATSDVHMNITGWDALRDQTVPGRGMDVLATLIAHARATAPGSCVLVDNGDVLQGAPIGDVCAAVDSAVPHPWPAILNALRYDVVGLGNHDFDYGIPFLERIVAQTRAPTLCASFSKGGVAGVLPTTLLRRDIQCSDGTTQKLAIGATSILPPQTAFWNDRYLSGYVAFQTGKAAAQRAVSQLRAQGADIVLVLCHSGLPATGDDDENFANTIAHEVDGIDAMVLGHTHQHFPKAGGPTDLNGVPAVMPGFGADVLGQIDLRLGWTTAGWHVAHHSAQLRRPTGQTAADTAITALAAPALAQTRAQLNRVLTRSDTDVHSYFGMLRPGPCDALVARAMTGALAAHVAGTDLAALPCLASVAPMALGGRAGPQNFVEVPAGPVRARHIAMLTPYPNGIWGAVLSGAELWRWAERSAAFFGPGLDRSNRLVNLDAPSFNFDMLHGLETVIDPFRPAMFDPLGRRVDSTGHRVRALMRNGVAIEEDAQFLVAMTSYRGAGGGNFPGLYDDQTILRTTLDLRVALHDEVAQNGVPQDISGSVWQFETDPGQRVVIETSPNAAAYINEIASFAPEVIGENAAGFLEVSVAI